MRIVENNAQHLILRDRPPWGALAAFAAGALLPLVAVAFHEPPRVFAPGMVFLFAPAVLLRATLVVFDKARRTCTLRSFDLGGFRRRAVAFDDILEVRIEPSPRMGGVGAMSCRLSLATASGDIPLKRTYEPGPERYRIIREAVLDALSGGGRRPAAPGLVEAA